MNPALKSIAIQLNGERRQVREALSLAELLEALAIPKEKVVVELNLEVIPRERFGELRLKDDDQVEIVHFVGGGAVEKSLVIVESPAKCKTIHKYLGPNFEVAASMGHVVDLPRSKMGIDIEHNFEPQYIVVKEKKKTLSELKKKAKTKHTIYLACDPDREGEAISFHLKNELADGKKVARVVFNEITREAVLEAFKHPTNIDMNLVSAQQARRVLDRLVGYSLSPLLWQKVGRGLSAGRVQSVALRLIVDRENEIKAFVPEEYWTIEAELRKKKGKEASFIARLEKINGVKADVKDENTAHAALEKIKTHPFIVQEIRKQKKRRNPYPPFTTSKLQQAAYNVLHFPAAKTMKIAQTLYEGVEIGSEGSVGLITYMRTDAVRISETALKETRALIARDYGKSYLPPTPNVYKAKKQAQEAHEAIRPTSVHRRPKQAEKYLTPDQLKLYTLIWNQTVASQMTPAVILQETADIFAGEYLFRATGSRVEFAGCLVLQTRTEDQDNPLPPLKNGEELTLVKIDPLQHFTKPPARYTDASLVKALEEKGIGRPSTYAPILMTLLGRDYVRRDGGSLIPTELGILITQLLVQYFSKIMDFHFTATMEEDLDLIEEGKLDWTGVVKTFYGVFSRQVDYAKSKMKTVKRVAEPTDEICDQCGKPMVIKWGRRGRFISCSGWPACRNAKSISTEVVCPLCKKGKLVMRRAKSGKGRSFYGCTTYPECNFLSNRLPKAGETSSAGGASPETEPKGEGPGEPDDNG
jgi:DNA topoisomerase-1